MSDICELIGQFAIFWNEKKVNTSVGFCKNKKSKWAVKI